MLGFEDLHNSTFDDLRITADVLQHTESRANPQTKSFTTVGLHGDFGRCYMAVYPSDEMESSYLTPAPIRFTSMVLCVCFHDIRLCSLRCACGMIQCDSCQCRCLNHADDQGLSFGDRRLRKTWASVHLRGKNIILDRYRGKSVKCVMSRFC